jgi:hypothetical protein
MRSKNRHVNQKSPCQPKIAMSADRGRKVFTQPRPKVHIFGTKIYQFPNEIPGTPRFCSKFWRYKVSGHLQKTEKFHCIKSIIFCVIYLWNLITTKTGHSIIPFNPRLEQTTSSATTFLLNLGVDGKIFHPFPCRIFKIESIEKNLGRSSKSNCHTHKFKFKDILISFKNNLNKNLCKKLTSEWSNLQISKVSCDGCLTNQMSRFLITFTIFM